MEEMVQKTVNVTLKDVCRLTCQIDPIKVMQDGPMPRPKVISRLLAVRAAPRVSGGLTLMMQGRLFTEGNDAIQPPSKEYAMALYP